MRNRPLTICAKGHEPLTFTAPECPLCVALARIERLLVGQRETQDHRCRECVKKPPLNGQAVLGAKA
jgi:hypothetical protein